MKLAVGQLVYERAWCLPLWFQSLEAQELCPKEDITLLFAYSKGFDGTYEQLRYYGEEYGNLFIYEYDLPTWAERNIERFTTLAQLRNGLLNMAKQADCDYLLSWDNDILFSPKRLDSLFIGKDAVGALVDMGGNDKEMGYPSLMHFPAAPGEMAWRKPWNEYEHVNPFQCDVIMAVKLMTKEVYSNTQYRWDGAGEDIGWSYSCKEKGYEKWLQPQARGIHLYDKDCAIRCMKDNQGKEYPEILEPLQEWYRW